MTTLTILDTSIRADECGRFCLNDLHRAAGGNARHRPSLWMRHEQFRGLVAELERQSTEMHFAPVDRQRGGIGGSRTFVRRELVIAYAMWISPAFMLQVIRAFDGAQQRAMSDAAVQHQELAQLSLTLRDERAEASDCGRRLGKWGKRRRTLLQRIEALERVLQLSLDIDPPQAALQ
jgi:hypothetical protein